MKTLSAVVTAEGRSTLQGGHLIRTAWPDRYEIQTDWPLGRYLGHRAPANTRAVELLYVPLQSLNKDSRVKHLPLSTEACSAGIFGYNSPFSGLPTMLPAERTFFFSRFARFLVLDISVLSQMSARENNRSPIGHFIINLHHFKRNPSVQCIKCAKNISE